MRINDAALQQVLQSYKAASASETERSSKTDSSDEQGSKTDQISISQEGQGLQRMIRAAQNADDIRAEQVDAIRTKLRTGGYVIDPVVIAHRMLGLSGD